MTASRLYLIVNAGAVGSWSDDDVKKLLAAGDIACIRLTNGENADALRSAADRIVPITSGLGIAVVMENAADLVGQTSVDGVHFSDGTVDVAETRSAIGADTIVGVEFTGSRHDAMEAGQDGADYIAFGPGRLDDARWWADLFEIPCVAEAGDDAEIDIIASSAIEFLALRVAADPASPQVLEQIETATRCIEQERLRESA